MAPLSALLARQLLDTTMATETVFPLHPQAIPGTPEGLWKLWLGRTKQEAPLVCVRVSREETPSVHQGISDDSTHPRPRPGPWPRTRRALRDIALLSLGVAHWETTTPRCPSPLGNGSLESKSSDTAACDVPWPL